MKTVFGIGAVFCWIMSWSNAYFFPSAVIFFIFWLLCDED